MSRFQAGAVSVTFCALLVTSVVASAADKKGKANTPTTPTYTDLADTIFNKVDVHKQSFLNKTQFKKADKMLAGAIDDLLQQGTIGQKPAKGKGPASPPEFQPGFATADADHDGKVTLIEFTTYVSTAINAADQYYQYEAAHAPQPRTTRRRTTTTAPSP
jgi:Ca2+-binding EF-hand superfamily protein